MAKKYEAEYGELVKGYTLAHRRSNMYYMRAWKRLGGYNRSTLIGDDFRAGFINNEDYLYRKAQQEIDCIINNAILIRRSIGTRAYARLAMQYGSLRIGI